MERGMERRQFLQVTAAGSLFYLGASPIPMAAGAAGAGLISPGCRKSKVRVAKLYMGIPNAHWPTPTMDLNQETNRYEAEFAKRAEDFQDVEFTVSELLTSPDQVERLQDDLKDVDGILAIHLSMGVMGILRAVLAAEKPTVLYAAPYSGHEWTQFGPLRRQPVGAHLECMLTSDPDQLAVAVRPFRAIHHLREARILDVTMRELPSGRVKAYKDKFGTEIQKLGRDQVLAAYEAIPDAAAEAEAKRWIDQAQEVVEPPRDEIVRSCKLALAFERLLDDAEATAITVDCYGSMYRQLPAFPCIGFTRLNDMGYAGICESDLAAGMTFLLLQALSGKPGFISDPTMDESRNAVILAHCLGSTRMDGPQREPCPYKLRTIMEREEGAVPQVFMPTGRKVTQVILAGTDLVRFFTGEVIEAPDTERGCRTKIIVKVDGDPQALWQNWSHGLHRVTCYGDVTSDLKRFCRFKDIELVNEALPPIPPTPTA